MQLAVLGKVQQESGNYADALASYGEALAIVAKNDGNEHLRTARLHVNIGDIMRVQRHYDEAMVRYETALRVERKTLPADHLYLGATLFRLGDLQRRLGNLEAADEAFAESIRIAGKNPTGQYAQALQSYGNLARAQGRFDLAAQRFHQAFEVFKSTSGDSVYTWLTALLEVGALTELHRYAEAEALGIEATATLLKIAPDDAYNAMFAATVMGRLRHEQGRHAEAEPLFRLALENIEKVYDKNHAEVASVRVALASSLLSQDQAALREEAANLIQAAIASLSQAGDAGSEPMLGTAYLERSRLHWQNGDREAARQDIREATARLQSAEYAAALGQAKVLTQKYAALP
jgi:serine/threonine-protein kinase